MTLLKLIITADYEIFGNGSGNIDSCLIQPAEKMMNITEKHNARICFFVDVCEYWAFKEVYKKGLTSENNALKVENQIKDAINRGHDIQLHFHPQWLDYTFNKGVWNLNQKLWQLPEVEHLEGWSIKKLFQEGKKTLESIIQPINSDYKCDVFRAGAWCIQPETEVIEVMSELGFRIESTVAPCKMYNDGRTIYDFSTTPNLPIWKIKEFVNKEDNQGVITEYPIYTMKFSAFESFKFNRIKISKAIPNQPEGCAAIKDEEYKTTFFQKLIRAISPQVRMLNSSDGVSFEEMKYITQHAIRRYQHTKEETPIVMIGHPKTFGNEKEFDQYCAWASNQQELKIGGY